MGADRNRFRGLGPALITPMREDGSLDLDALDEHVRFCVGGGSTSSSPAEPPGRA